MIGRTVSKYEIEEKIGQGGMGVVYKARDLTLPRHVAIKFLPSFMGADSDARERFEREADATAALHHPNIADIYETGETEDGQLFIVMPFYEGRTLQRLIDDGVDRERALDLFVQLARGVAKAHDKGIVHRDLKPDNAFVTDDGFVKVLDFGLARFAGSTRMTRSGIAVGTVRYMSPEQARGEEVGTESDVFSLGVMLYQLLTGEVPFHAEHDQAVLYRITTEEPPPLPNDVPEVVRGVVARSLAKDPRERYANAGEMLAALGGSSVGIRQRRRRFTVRNRLTVAAIAVLAVSVAALAYFFPRSETPDVALAPSLPGKPLVVFPFDVRGTESIGYLREGMVDLLSAGLNDVRDLHTVDPRGMYKAIANTDGDVSDPAVSQRVASSLGASLFLVGSVVEAAGRFQASARLYDNAGTLVTEATARVDDEAHLFELAEDIARQVVLAVFEEAPSVPRRFDTTLPALKAYLKGEALLRSGRFNDAVAAFQQAVDEDSVFALAWARLADTATYTDDLLVAHNAMDKALAMGDDLPQTEREKLLATQEFEGGRFVEAEQMLRAYLGKHPRDPNAWFYLADGYFHGAPLYGKDPAESWPAFRRAVEYGFPEDDYALQYHMRASAAWAGDQGAYVEILQRLMRLDPEGDLSGSVKVELASATGDQALRRTAFEELSAAPDWLLSVVQWGLSLVAHDIEGAREAALLWAQPQRSSLVRAQGHIAAAYFDLMRGKMTSAEEQLALAGPLDSLYAVEFSSFAALLPFPDSEARLLRARDRLLDTRPVTRPTQEIDPWVDVHGDVHDLVVASALASVLIRLGEMERAGEVLDRLESSGDSPAMSNVAQELAASGRAALALAAGDTTTAIDMLEKERVQDWWVRSHVSPFFSSVSERFTLAQVLERRGMVDDALRWYKTTAYQSPYDLVYLPWSCYEAGKMLEAAGRGAEAVPYYDRFISLWSGCDAELEPIVDDARARRARL